MNLIIGEKASKEKTELSEDMNLPTEVSKFDVTAAKGEIDDFISDELKNKYNHVVISFKKDWLDFHQVDLTDIVWGDEI